MGKTEGKKRRGQQRKNWLASITRSMDMNLSKLQEIVEERGAWCATVHEVAKSWTRLSDWTTTKQTNSLRRLLLSLPGWRNRHREVQSTQLGSGTEIKPKLLNTKSSPPPAPLPCLQKPWSLSQRPYHLLPTKWFQISQSELTHLSSVLFTWTFIIVIIAAWLLWSSLFTCLPPRLGLGAH